MQQPSSPAVPAVSERMLRIGTESAFEVSARARALEAQGRSIVHLNIGEPDADSPRAAIAAAKAALDAGATHYGPYAGLPDLRAAVADDVRLRKGVAARPEDVFITVGGKGVMVNTILGLIDPGDEVIVPDPAYPIYDSLTRFCGGVPVPIPLRAEDGFALDPDRVAAAIGPRTKMLVLNSPANPTGGVIGRAALERLAELAVAHGLLVLSDEIYARILYDGEEHVSIAALPGMAERTVILDGFSKTYAMTGWRLGYAVVPAWFAPHFGRLIINTISCVPTFVQHGAVAALRGPQDEVDAMVAELAVRRDIVVDGLNAIPGFRCTRPTGAFYAFPDVSGTGLTGVEMAERLLMEAGVCVLSGAAFGAAAEGNIRISYATSRDALRSGLERIDTFVRGL
ncbi:MAG: pyridoxal phosphate-dependent aminotransferase [Chloroflexota bacterium]